MATAFQGMTVAVEGERVAVTGEVDASNAAQLREALIDAARAPGVQLDVNLKQVTFMDSSGLKAIADAAVEIEATGSGLTMSNVPRQVMRILYATELGTLLKVHQ